MESIEDVSTKFGPEAAEAVNRYCQQTGLPLEDAMNVLNIHGQAGIDFLGKYANGIDPATAAKMSGVPQDWIEGVRGIAERKSLNFSANSAPLRCLNSSCLLQNKPIPLTTH